MIEFDGDPGPGFLAILATHHNTEILCSLPGSLGLK